jgi:spermidine/putrescine transport system substrate-binding protein
LLPSDSDPLEHRTYQRDDPIQVSLDQLEIGNDGAGRPAIKPSNPLSNLLEGDPPMPRISLPQRRTKSLIATPIVIALTAAACGSGDDGNAAEQVSCEVGQVDGDLALYNWSEYIDPEELAAFETEFDISATMDVFDSNEAMQSIVAAGNSGYDVIVPSSYMVQIMRTSSKLSPLDLGAIPNVANLSADFTGLDYDSAGEYSVPYQAGTTGIAVDTEVVGTDFERSWSLIFDPVISAEFDGRISLLNDPREVLGAALVYLGYSINSTDSDQLDEAQELVAAARDRVAAFDTDSADELLVTGETAIGHGYSGDMLVQFLETDDPDRYQYFVPQEGGARWLDAMAIPFDAPHPCTAHTFMNWVLEPDHGAALSNWNFYETPNEAARAGLDEDLLAFLEDPTVVVGGPDSLELIQDTGEFEINYSDAFIAAKG